VSLNEQYSSWVPNSNSINDKWALVPRSLLDNYTSAFGEHDRYECSSEAEHAHCLSGHESALLLDTTESAKRGATFSREGAGVEGNSSCNSSERCLD